MAAKTYTITLTRTVTSTATIKVEAESRQAAIYKAAAITPEWKDETGEPEVAKVEIAA